ncbi:MAG: DUF5693 family protein [Armatimonadota bacterium]
MTSPSPASTRSLFIICLVLIALGLLAAVYGLKQRISAESSSKAVDIVMDYRELVGLAGMEGVPLETVLERVKGAGATAVALQEETIGDMENAGELEVRHAPGEVTPPLPEFPADANPVILMKPRTDASGFVHQVKRSDGLILQSSSIFTDDILRDGLQRAYPENSWREEESWYYIEGDPEIIRGLGLGLDPAKVEQIKAAGLRVMPRLKGGAGVSTRNLPASLAAVAAQIGEGSGETRGVLVFDGTMIPGYRTLLGQLARELEKNHLAYGAVEFAKQKGDAQLGAKLKGQIVRVHSISEEELSNLQPLQAIQRFGLAVKDRNIRVLYVHLPPVASERPGTMVANPKLQSTAQYVSGIKHEITTSGFTAADNGPAHPFKPLSLPRPLLALLFAGAAAGFLLWILSVLPAELPRGYVRVGYALVVLGLLLAFVFSVKMTSMGRMLFGLLAAVGYPMLALTWAYRKIDQLPKEKIHPLLSGIGALVVATLITLGGALLIAAMMAESRFLVKVGQFAGVKAALALPLLLFGALIVTDGVAKAGESFADYTARVRDRVREFLWKPLYLWGALAGVAALMAVALLLARSGNDSGVGVSDLELQFRSTLEQWLVARPRTKEFMLGHPLFLFAMVAGARGQRVLALVLLLGAAIGQVDVLNTYCHAHTPVLLSLLRTANGLWLGIGVGVILLAVFARKTLVGNRRLS